MNLKPLGNRLVVETIEEEEMTAGGIVLPKPQKRNPRKGKSFLRPGDRNEKGDRIQMD